MTERSGRSRGSRRTGACALALLSALAFAACGGDTIVEGDPLVTVSIDQQETARQVNAGSAARLLAHARSVSSGIATIEITAEGALEGSLSRDFPDRPQEISIEAFIAIPDSAAGALVLSVVATNADGAKSEPDRIQVEILEPDVVPPEVAVESVIPDRVEVDDSIAVRVRCADPGENGQLAWCGYHVRFHASDGDTLVVARRDSVLGADTALIDTVIAVRGFDPQRLPEDVRVEVHGFAIDAAGQCGAGTVGEFVSGGCIGAGTGIRAGSPQSDPTVMTVVASRTIERGTTLPIADFTVDEGRGLLYGSVTDRNRVEVFDITVEPSEALVGSFEVGALPLGMSLDRTGDTLIIANSGGTSLSFVDLATGQEHSRLETHNAVLYTLRLEPTGWVLSWQDFGDRPAHVTQDRDGVLFYSTVTPGPIRMVENDAAWSRREAHIMLWTDVLDPVQSPPEWSITYVDSMMFEPESVYGGASVRVWDHVPGTSQIIMTEGSPDDFEALVDDLRGQGSDIFAVFMMTWAYDYWNTAGDVLFAADADRSTIAIGDASRVWLWDARGEHPGLSDRFISDFTAIEDLTNNGADQGVTGVAVNADGDNFAVRGGSSALFFDPLLRLHGSHTDPALAGAGGVAMHPTEDLAFVPTGDRSVLVIETTGHYRVRAELPLVQTLVAPVTISLPRDGDPPGLVGRLHGMSIDGDAVTLPIWESALQ